MSAFKAKVNEQKFCVQYFEVLESFVELFSKQKNGLGILVTTVRINCLEVSSVVSEQCFADLIGFSTIEIWM